MKVLTIYHLQTLERHGDLSLVFQRLKKNADCDCS